MEREADNPVQTITQNHLGLLTRTYVDNKIPAKNGNSSPCWPAFAAHVEDLNKKAPEGVSFKVIFLTRHGEAVHNRKEGEVGSKEWNTKWVFLDGDGTSVWVDSDLTEMGHQQAAETGQIWSKLVEEQDMPLPALHVSPLQRCLRTSRVIFQDMSERQGQHYQPIVKEMLREITGRNTCNRRNTKSWIHENFPEVVFEDGFAENDELFDPDASETEQSVIVRQQAALEDIFTNEPNDFVAVTAHSVNGRGMMAAFEHEIVKMAPGSTMVFLLKGTKLSESQSETLGDEWLTNTPSIV
ncbi:histidine phosphatase superfamily [Truncatella angustata]|uniref:Histidine phosphatase superfamily n=1 Tax=Truncatella angustata TaxID=152316 RepID=A0A9P9A0Y9_9PEZI|nr:histidine phosphatase superfamily [Truncatella angustata]KAH6656480.1 histidine phosphatase superfamily [Truncatella angustata]